LAGTSDHLGLVAGAERNGYPRSLSLISLKAGEASYISKIFWHPPKNGVMGGKSERFLVKVYPSLAIELLVKCYALGLKKIYFTFVEQRMFLQLINSLK
jgi:hypothetical protein